MHGAGVAAAALLLPLAAAYVPHTDQPAYPPVPPAACEVCRNDDYSPVCCNPRNGGLCPGGAACCDCGTAACSCGVYPSPAPTPAPTPLPAGPPVRQTLRPTGVYRVYWSVVEGNATSAVTAVPFPVEPATSLGIYSSMSAFQSLVVVFDAPAGTPAPREVEIAIEHAGAAWGWFVAVSSCTNAKYAECYHTSNNTEDTACAGDSFIFDDVVKPLCKGGKFVNNTAGTPYLVKASPGTNWFTIPPTGFPFSVHIGCGSFNSNGNGGSPPLGTCGGFAAADGKWYAGTAPNVTAVTASF